VEVTILIYKMFNALSCCLDIWVCDDRGTGGRSEGLSLKSRGTVSEGRHQQLSLKSGVAVSRV